MLRVVAVCLLGGLLGILVPVARSTQTLVISWLGITGLSVLSVTADRKPLVRHVKHSKSPEQKSLSVFELGIFE